MADDIESLLKPLCKSWLAVIKKANDIKRTEFTEDADEAMQFFDGPYDFMYSSAKGRTKGDDAWAKPSFCMTYNKIAEMVQLFGPTLYHRNPYRQITPAKMMDLPPLPPPPPQLQMAAEQGNPQAQQMLQQMQQQQQMQQMMLQQQLDAAQQQRDELASQLMAYLNYTPNELDLRGESRMVIDEALIKGMGVWWTAPFKPPGSPITMVGSFYECVDNIAVDPDMDSIEKAKWAARKRVFPVWEVEDRFRLKRGTLRGNAASFTSQAQRSTYRDYEDDRRRGETNDLYTYWEVYSRMGMGTKLHTTVSRRAMDTMDDVFEQFGEHCFLAVSEDYECPLNLPEYVTEKAPMEEVFARVQWPVPFWAEHTNPWPFTYLAFHKRPNKLWPMSHVKPALGELKFLNWAFSFIADKIKNTSRDFIGVMKSVGEEMKTAILSGKDLTILEIESGHGKTIQEVVSFLQHPQFNGDVYKVIDVMMSLLEKRLGLNELMYGETAKQDRSATVSAIKGDQIKIRPDDMAECVEDASTKLGRKEAICARWTLEPPDVAPIGGPVMSQMWGTVVQNADPYQVVLELEYRLESGSVRKPNKNRDQDNANAAMQAWGQVVLAHFNATGDVTNLNALAEVWCKANDYPVEKMQFSPPPPPQPDPQVQQEHQMEMERENQKAQLEAQKAQMDMQLKTAELQAKLQADAQAGQTELQLKQIEGQQDMQIAAADGAQKLQLAQAEAGQEMRQATQSFLLDMLQKKQEFALDMQQKEAEGELALKLAKQQAAAKPKPKPAA